MKDLSKKIKNGGVEKITSLEQLGGSKNGKGSFPRFHYQSDSEYKRNFDNIFRKKKENGTSKAD